MATIDELQVQITALTAGFKKDMDGVNSKLKELGSTSEASGNKIEASLSKAGKAAGVALAAAGAVAAAGIGLAVKSFAEYEQLVGGVETLFKKSSDEVLKYSKIAYRTAGLSANDYMETVTSFSASLLQGLKGDTEAAVKYADMAIIDMADNANKMGTNIGMIQYAYQGFAKDNFTMLDNLKLGYGGTAGEMARLVNDSGVLGESFKATAENVKDIPFDKLILAIHKTQEEMGIAGTTAKEASETISGSWNSTKAAFENVLTGVEGSGKALAQSILNLFGQLVEKVPVIVANMATGMYEALSEALPVMVDRIAQDLTTQLQQVDWGSVYAAIIPDEEVRNGITTIFQSLSGALTAAWEVIQPVIAWFIETMWPILQTIGEYIGGQFKEAWDSLVATYQANKEEIMLLGGLIGGLLIGALILLVAAIVAVVTIIATLINWIAKVAEFFSNLWDTIVNGILWVVDEAIKFYEDMTKWFGDTWEWIKKKWGEVTKWFGDVYNGIINWFKNIPTNLRSFFDTAWSWVKSIWQGVGRWFGDRINDIFNFFRDIPTNIKNFFKDAWDKVKNIDWIQLGRDIVAGIAAGISPTAVVDKMKSLARDAMGAVKSFLGIKSPSRVMRDEVGKMMGAGMAEGIDESTRAAVRAASKSARSVLGAYNGSFTTKLPTSGQLERSLNSSMSVKMQNIDPRQTPIVIDLDGERLLSFVIDGVNGRSFMSNQSSIRV